VVTADPDVLDDVLRLAAAAGVDVDAAPDLIAARPRWLAAPLILVGADAAEAVGRSRLRRRPAVVVVGRDRNDADIWPRAVGVGAEHVALLPDAEPWLVNRLADTRDGTGRSGRVISVVGGRGGAGATTLAAAIATTSMRRRWPSIFIDADPLGGGADLVFGGENAAGLRWPDLASTQGRLAPLSLRQALPTVGELAVLSWDRGNFFELCADAMASVVDAAARACELVVVDLPRRFDDVCDVVLSASDLVLMVVPAEVRAVAAAARVAARLAGAANDIRLVVRGPAPGGLDPGDIASALGLPLAGALKAEPDLAAALERGVAPAGRGLGPLAAFCEQLLDQLDRQHDGPRSLIFGGDRR
jgi:secretion/DNA translocation related CpaE-like protein